MGSSTTVYNTKYNAGTSRHTVSIVKKMPWYISHNIDVYCLILTNEKIFFTPKRMLVFKNFMGVGCRNYNNMEAKFNVTNFVENEFVNSDAEIVKYTLRYVNKNDGPYKRFNNNQQIPICRYGEVSLKSEGGINILMEYSNCKLMDFIQKGFTKFTDYNNQMSKLKPELENFN